jgi:hypothetical protein
LSDPFDEKAAARLRRSRDIAFLGGLMAALVTANAVVFHGVDQSWEGALRWFSAGITDTAFVFNVFYYREQRRFARQERQAFADMRAAAAAFAEILRAEMAKRGIDATNIEVDIDQPTSTTRH